MIRVGGKPVGRKGADVKFCNLFYPGGDEISPRMADRLRSEPFYQADKFAQAMAKVSRRRTAVDCGAWVGGWSVELAKLFEQVVVIEANPDNARCAEKNLASFKNANVFNCAVGDETKEVLVGPREDGGKVSSFVGAPGGFSVPMMRLDDLLRDAPIAIDYLKIHVNGMELKALRGAKETILRHLPVLTVVLRPTIEDIGDTREAARKMLYGWGYRRAGGEKPYEIWAPK